MPVDADLTTENGKVRLNIGDVEIPYKVQNEIINAFLSLYPDAEEGARIYFATLDTLRYLKANFATSGAARRREREGGVEIEVYGSEEYENICDLLDWFEANPPSSAGVPPASFIFGGVSAKEIARVSNDPDRVGPRAYLGYLDNDQYSLTGDDSEYHPESFYPVKDI